MVKINKLQLFCSALTVAFAFSGCRGRQVQQPASVYQPQMQHHAPMQQHLPSQQIAPVPDNQMLIPTPDDTLPPTTGAGPALGQTFQNLEPVSSVRKKGLLRLLPMFRNKNVPQPTMMPSAGTILTEEQFNALSGQAVTLPQNSQQRMQPMPEALLPSVPQSTHRIPPQANLPVQSQRHQQIPAQQVQFNGSVPVHMASSVRHQTPVQSNAPRPVLIRDFAPNTFGAAANLNFGGAWGQKVSQVNQVQRQPDVATYGDPLEIPNIDESYDLWPQSPAESNVTQQAQPAAGMPAMSNIPSQGMVGSSDPMMRVTEQSHQQAQQPEQNTYTLPMIVPAPKNQ